MTTHELIAALRRGAPVTPRLVREIIIHLERLDWAERSLKAALEKYGNDSAHRTAIEPQAGTKSNHGSNHKKKPRHF